ncbi:unnamed protein product [Phaedon cochleariae]|uniref:MADF domain-containing protein n=1 Tax=Phaedon cochleariae TaxID=80249 RepID=A0A9N9SGY3_PHACE|nr:unnamed protein product [Phaedon cochleariae]CAH1173923.1 unnamed protein product [Phaedon cochleariae]
MEKIVNDGQLIELVRQFSVLYDPKNREYKNNEVKSNAWKTIAEVMNASVADCEARWISLRTIYSRESKKVRTTPTGSAATKPWRWLEEMAFLSAYMRRRQTRGNVQTVGPPEPSPSTSETSSENPWDSISIITGETESQEEDPILETSNIEEDSPIPEISQTSTPSSTPSMTTMRNERSKRKRTTSTTTTTELMETINKAWGTFDAAFQQKNNSQDNDNADTTFGKMVGLELSEIKDKNIKFNAKQKILKILHEASNEDE